MDPRELREAFAANLRRVRHARESRRRILPRPIGRVEIDGIEIGVRHECVEADDPRPFRVERLQLVLGQGYEPAALDLLAHEGVLAVGRNAARFGGPFPFGVAGPEENEAARA